MNSPLKTTHGEQESTRRLPRSLGTCKLNAHRDPLHPCRKPGGLLTRRGGSHGPGGRVKGTTPPERCGGARRTTTCARRRTDPSHRSVPTGEGRQGMSVQWRVANVLGASLGAVKDCSHPKCHPRSDGRASCGPSAQPIMT